MFRKIGRSVGLLASHANTVYTDCICIHASSDSLGHFGQHSPGGVTMGKPPQPVTEKQGVVYRNVRDKHTIF